MRDLNTVGSNGAIRLLVAIGSLGTGGSETQLTELVIGLPRERFETTVLTFDGSGSGLPRRHRDRLESAGIPIIGIVPIAGAAVRRWARLGTEVMRALDRHRPDLVYAWLDETAAILAPLARAKRIPCLVARRNIIGSTRERHNPLLRPLLRRAETSALLVTANSHAVAMNCVERGHRPERVRRVRNGHLSLDPLPSPPTPPLVFGYVAQLRPEKGHRRLLDALSSLPGGSWRIDMAGDGALRAALESRVAADGLSDRVRFLGNVDDVRRFWGQCHVAMLLSDSEGLPNALLEAGFAGRPAIATDTGGVSEVVGPGGIVVPLDERGAITAAMAELIDNPSRREALGLAGWRHVTANFMMEAMVADHAAALEETLRLRPVTSAFGARERRTTEPR